MKTASLVGRVQQHQPVQQPAASESSQPRFGEFQGEENLEPRRTRFIMPCGLQCALGRGAQPPSGATPTFGVAAGVPPWGKLSAKPGRIAIRILVRDQLDAQFISITIMNN